MLEYADEMGFDAIGVNEHHQNAYGMMPSPNLMAAALARRTTQGDDPGARQLDRALQPADPRRRGVRDARRDLRRPADRRLPGRHVDGLQLLLRREPGHAARQVSRGARPDHQGVGGARAVRVERQVHQAALREPVAAADPEAAPADLDPGARLDRDVGFLHRPRLQLQLPVVQRLQARPEDDGRLLGAHGEARQAGEPLHRARSSSRCASASATRTASASGGRTSTTSSTSACTSIPAWPRRPAIAPRRRCARASSRRSATPPATWA